MKYILVVATLVLTGCAIPRATYWAFPTGATEADFKGAEATCNQQAMVLLRRGMATHRAQYELEQCMINSGFTMISPEEYFAQQARRQAFLRDQIKAVSKSMNVAAYDVKTRDIYVGKSEPLMDERGGSAVTIEDLNSSTRCSGRTDTQDAGKGSIHSATLLCRDGRLVEAVFTHETLRSGYGTAASINLEMFIGSFLAI